MTLEDWKANSAFTPISPDYMIGWDDSDGRLDRPIEENPQLRLTIVDCLNPDFVSAILANRRCGITL